MKIPEMTDEEKQAHKEKKMKEAAERKAAKVSQKLIYSYIHIYTRTLSLTD